MAIMCAGGNGMVDIFTIVTTGAITIIIDRRGKFDA